MKDEDCEVGLWFRDRLHEVLGLGIAAFTVVGGWLLSSDSVVSLDHPKDTDHRQAAVLLLTFVPLLWLAWYLYLVRIRARCPEHPTVVARSAVHAIACAVGIGLAVLLYAIAFD